MDMKTVMAAVRLASQRDAAIAAQAEAALEAARAASNNIVGIDFEQSNVTSSYALDVAYGDGLWLAGSDTATYYSSDGKEWTQNTTISKACSSFTYANGLWVAGGYAGGGLYYSVDGKAGLRATSQIHKSEKQPMQTVCGSQAEILPGCTTLRTGRTGLQAMLQAAHTTTSFTAMVFGWQAARLCAITPPMARHGHNPAWRE